MKVKDIKVGLKCHDRNASSGPVTITSIEKADRKNGIWETKVTVTDQTSGKTYQTWPLNLTNWEEHETAARAEKLARQEMTQHVETIKAAVGNGVRQHGKSNENHSDFVRIRFTEQAAEKTLEKLGAKPIPENRRPSKAPPGDKQARERLCVLLSQRLRRAFGAGYAGDWISESLQAPYVAELFFYNGSVADAAAKISGSTKSSASALSQILG